MLIQSRAGLAGIFSPTSLAKKRYFQLNEGETRMKQPCSKMSPCRERRVFNPSVLERRFGSRRKSLQVNWGISTTDYISGLKNKSQFSQLLHGN